jgi:hypothetical protein
MDVESLNSKDLHNDSHRHHLSLNLMRTIFERQMALGKMPVMQGAAN